MPESKFNDISPPFLGERPSDDFSHIITSLKNSDRVFEAKCVGAGVGALVAHHHTLKRIESVNVLRRFGVIQEGVVMLSPFVGGMIGASLGNEFGKFLFPVSWEDSREAMYLHSKFVAMVSWKQQWRKAAGTSNNYK